MLIGPGKIQVNGITDVYSEIIYISTANISSLSEVSGVADACKIRYSSKSYAEDISVNQSCVDIIKLIKKSNQ